MLGVGWGNVVKSSGRGMAGTCSRFLLSVDCLPQVIARLKRAQIENVSALTVIERYTTENSLCYCDPPYVSSTRKSGGYEDEMTDEDHEKLLELLLETKGKVVVSGYPNELYEDYLGDWYKVEFEVACHAAARTRNSKLQGKGSVLKHAARTEVLWLNEKAFRASGEQLSFL